MASFTPIINAALDQNWTDLDLLLEKDDISRTEKIDALELAGAVILSDTENSPQFARAFSYWRKSLHLGSMETDGSGPIIKKLQENLKKTGRIVEWTTSEELERTIQNPSEHFIQSFLVQSRILSARSWEATHSLLFDFFSRSYKKRNDQQHQDLHALVHISWSMLEVIRRFDPREDGLWLITSRIAYNLCHDLTSYLYTLHAETIEISLELLLATDQLHLDECKLPADRLFIYQFGVFSLIKKLATAVQPDLITEHSMAFLSELVTQNKRRYPDESSEFSAWLLEMSCDPAFQCLTTTEFLLRAGADPNVDIRCNIPLLHYLALNMPDDAPTQAIAQLLLKYGAHLDRVDKNRKTAAEAWREAVEYRTRRSRRFIPMPNWLREDSPPKLMCLCARVIRSNGMPFVRLPKVLRRFVSMH